ncbi:MAG TPA: hypothetical protein VFO65_11050 [Acidimicrobiales bacterium]|nr:hypothetical protein [Acidimicrobiales bacterium]
MEPRSGGAAALLALSLPEPATRLVRALEPTGPALVLGSTQPDAVVDAAACAEAGVEVARRRSGGGAVLAEPGRLVWVDVVVPAGDPLWTVDVGRAFHWLGEAWCRALARLGVTGLEVHRGPPVRTRWSELVCFAGVGSGEVVTAGGAKVVGMSQRRRREAALFQCGVPLAWDPAAMVRLLALPAADRHRAAAELSGVVHPVPRATPEQVVAALLAELGATRSG